VVSVKRLARATAEFLPGAILGCIPLRVFGRLAKWILRVRLLRGKPVTALQVALEIDNAVYGICGQLAVTYGNGDHAKHRLTGYIEYFAGMAARFGGPCLDVGCGNGVISNEVASRLDDPVVGIDLSKERIETARRRYSRPNLRFVVGDATRADLGQVFSTIILSNVLEHIGPRVAFLEKLLVTYRPRHILVRIPNFERDWRVPLKKELGVEWRSDRTHMTEHTVESFEEEIQAAGLHIQSCVLRWGEIWAVVVPQTAAGVEDAL